MVTLTNITITAYCACTLCCGKHATGLTASGKAPRQGITVAASRKYQLGSHLTVSGMTNQFIIEDRLAKRFDDRVDIYFSSHQAAKQFGIHHGQTINISPK